MNEMIRQYHNPNDANNLCIDADITLWTDETQIIEKESTMFVNLLSARLVELSKSRNVNFTILFDEIDYFRNVNPEYQEKIVRYRLKLDGLQECEDLQCETHFLDVHRYIKTDIELHLKRYRKLKKNIFDTLDQYV